MKKNNAIASCYLVKSSQPHQIALNTIDTPFILFQGSAWNSQEETTSVLSEWPDCLYLAHPWLSASNNEIELPCISHSKSTSPMSQEVSKCCSKSFEHINLLNPQSSLLSWACYINHYGSYPLKWTHLIIIREALKARLYSHKILFLVVLPSSQVVLSISNFVFSMLLVCYWCLLCKKKISSNYH